MPDARCQPQGFYKYLANKDRPWKYQDLADAMRAINSEDECNDTYGRIRMYQALLLKNLEGLKIPSERTVYRVMDEIGLSHRPKRKSNGITRTDWEARKLDDLLRRDFKSNKPLEKCITDITEIHRYPDFWRLFYRQWHKHIYHLLLLISQLFPAQNTPPSTCFCQIHPEV